MTAKEQLLAKVQQIKQSTELIMRGGDNSEQVITDVTEDQKEFEESI